MIMRLCGKQKFQFGGMKYLGKNPSYFGKKNPSYFGTYFVETSICFNAFSVSLDMLVCTALHENLDAVALLQSSPHFMCEYKSVRRMLYKSDPSSILNLLKWKYLQVFYTN